MKPKTLNFLLILTSLFGYLEWGGGNSAFLFQAEGEIIAKLFFGTASIVHPFILLPMAGQILLVITLFQKEPNKVLTFVGLAGIGILLIFMFVIGLLSLNFKILISTIPFLFVVFLTIANRGKRKAKTDSKSA